MKTAILSFVILLAGSLSAVAGHRATAKAAGCCTGGACCTNCPTCCANCCPAGCCGTTCCGNCPDCCK